MDLEALPPEDPTPAPAAGAGPAEAPSPTWSPAPWQPAPWTAGAAAGSGSWVQPGAPAAEMAVSRLGLSRSTKILSGAIATAVIAAGAWAAGTALHSSGSAVRFQPASSTATAASTGGGSGGTGSTPTSPTTHRRAFGFGGGGVVASVDPASSSFAVTRPTRVAPTTPGATPLTPGAAPATPTTKTANIKVTATTTYYLTEPGTSSDIATGMRIVAAGTGNTDGSLTATAVELVQSGIGPAAPKAPTAPGGAPLHPGAPIPPNAPLHPNAPVNPPFALGTVKSVMPGSGGNVTVVVTSPRGDRTVTVTSTTTITKTVTGSFGDVKVGEAVLARGQRNTDGSVTATTVQIIAAGLNGRGRFGFGFGPGFAFGFGRGRGPGVRGGPGGPGGLGRWGGGGPPAAGPTGSTTAASPI